ncbi:hypothetical protein [Halorientalis regularis]|uniref:Uncharacterized protein n=1 Tax=Halorientalis regularis TaxID=660518 RepID=A0A1G7QP13_9EURY|nr:hypothetical protein [Halorientalis regularis]SDG00266.1 hypothetical protein SAMN05216218_11335 [Halorientalis regularis]
MNLYENRFDTDWDHLDRDEAMERAFALGVAASLGQRNEEEYEAVHQAMGTNYDASIVELAYKEGKQKGTKRKRAVDNATDLEDIWAAVISAELDDDEPAEDDDTTSRATDLPSAVSDLPEMTEQPDRDPEQTEFPEFLE